MNYLVALAAVALAGSTMGASAAPAMSGEDQISKAISGRVEGKPTDCLYQRDIRSTRIIDRTAILYEMNNGTIYVNRPASGASFLNSNYALVTNTHSSQLCSIDIVRLYDFVSRFEAGSIGLGPFVPYQRPGRVRGRR